jgi:hypothetical protein
MVMPTILLSHIGIVAGVYIIKALQHLVPFR